MIEKLTLLQGEINFLNFEHINKLDFFKTNREITFKKGINLILGKNGSGKSTLLNILAIGLAAKQGGYSKMTDSWFNAFKGFSPSRSFLKNFDIKHDGQGILYQNPRESVGLIFGQFDDDFMTEGIFNVQNKNSTGLTTLDRLNLFFKYIGDQQTVKFNTDYLERIEINNLEKSKTEDDVHSFFMGCIEKGQKTILMDEPETGLSFEYQYNLFNLIQEKAKALDLQIIISTHSPALYLFKEANLIELTEKYIDNLDLKVFTIYDIMMEKLIEREEKNK